MNFNSEYDVFLSYCWADKEIVRPIAETFKQHGLRVWIDINSTANTGELNNEVINGILNSAVVVLFVSDAFVKSHNCKLECSFANDQRKTIFSVRLDHSELVRNSLAAFFTSGQLYVDFNSALRANPRLKAQKIAEIEQRCLSLINKSMIPLEPHGIAIPPLRDLPNPKSFINREDIWTQLDNDFENHNTIALRGVGGSGKTYATLIYAFRMVDQGHNVYFMNCDSPESILNSYRVYVDWAHKHDNKEVFTKDMEELLRIMCDPEVKTSSRDASFIVLDNVEDYAHVKSIINSHSIFGMKFLITTRKSLLVNDIEQIRSVQVSLPSDEMSLAYLQSSLSKAREVTNEQCIQILKYTNSLPLRIATAVKYLTKHTAVSVDAYLQMVEEVKTQRFKSTDRNDIYPEVSLSIDDIRKTSKTAYDLLMLCAYLNPDSIVLNVLNKYLDSEIDIFTNLIRSTVRIFAPGEGSGVNKQWLSDVSLITEMNLFSCAENPNIVSIHRSIQADIQERLDDMAKCRCKRFAERYEMVLRDGRTLVDEILNGRMDELIASTSNMTRLDLRDRNIGVEGAKNIARLLKVKEDLTELNLGGNSIGDEGVKSICESLKENTSLVELNLRNNNITAEGARFIGKALQQHKSLTVLSLKGADGAVAISEALKTNAALTELNLRSCQIGPLGMKALSEAIAVNNMLKDLNLRTNAIGDGVKCIAKVLPLNSSLEKLNLGDNQITFEETKILCEGLKTNKSLKEVNLEVSWIGLDGVRLIEEIEHVTSISFVLSGQLPGRSSRNRLSRIITN
ncbi:cytokinesis protein 3 [Nowakowskiella sp. JEL0407]|nr:cytokinesis protein 3 [Nowakowskiella sp. JEL0407]